MTQAENNKSVVIIGAGPAGLTAGYELSKHGVPTIVLEADQVVGGIARTVNYKGYLLDIGPHRFFTKWNEVDLIWKEVLGDKFLLLPRLTRIYYRNKFFSYPLEAKNALFGLGPVESLRIAASYLRSQFNHAPKEENLEQWVCNRFGKRLYEIFFKTYTEKVWGVPCTSISAEWAAQRIRGLSLKTAILNALLPKKKPTAKTLTTQFHYPERGAGQMWEALAQRISEARNAVVTDRRVVRICHSKGVVTRLVTRGARDEECYSGTHFISSMPVRDLINALDPPPPDDICRAANSLRYRDLLVVNLIIGRKDVVPDNWIYVHEPGVRVGRIQDYKNWSLAMVPDTAKTCLGMEYFVFQDDQLWSGSDAQVLDLARQEIVKLGLVQAVEVEDGTVIRMPKAYPMYDAGWTEHITRVRGYLESNLSNLQLIGRNGLHKYNNQDHSMVTGLCAARNILGARHDLWAINTEPDYQEESEQ